MKISKFHFKIFLAKFIIPPYGLISPLNPDSRKISGATVSTSANAHYWCRSCSPNHFLTLFLTLSATHLKVSISTFTRTYARCFTTVSFSRSSSHLPLNSFNTLLLLPRKNIRERLLLPYLTEYVLLVTYYEYAQTIYRTLLVYTSVLVEICMRVHLSFEYPRSESVEIVPRCQGGFKSNLTRKINISSKY